jgi:DNA-binding transcriptional ArsR family regulator
MMRLKTRLAAMHRLGRAMSDPTRCRILLRLVDGPAYPAALADELELTRPNVSNHLTCLRGCGLVVVTPEGRQMRYELADGALARGLRELLEVTLVIDGCPVCDGACSHEVAP